MTLEVNLILTLDVIFFLCFSNYCFDSVLFIYKGEKGIFWCFSNYCFDLVLYIYKGEKGFFWCFSNYCFDFVLFIYKGEKGIDSTRRQEKCCSFL